MKYMDLAIKQAIVAEGLGEVPIGCIIVDTKKDQILAEAGNSVILSKDPTAHAEVCCIRKAAKKIRQYRLSDADLYVTLEPCVMCAAAISEARIKNLYFGAYDPKKGAVENGVRFFDSPSSHHKPGIYGVISELRCRKILKSFFKSLR